MKYLIIFFFSLIFLGCKTQENQAVILTGEQLPAYHIESSKEASTINSILQSSDINKNNKLIINGKEYPISETQAILDTISYEYTLSIKADTVANRKLLIVTY